MVIWRVFMWGGTGNLSGNEFKLLKVINKSEIFVCTDCMHCLINLMHKCLREAIFNGGGPTYYWKFLLLRSILLNAWLVIISDY